MDDTRAAPITDDLYAVLGVECDADDARIEHAFHVLAHRLHPDTRPPDADTEPVDPEVFRRILAAYAVLRDPLARRRYDNRHRRTHLADPGTAADPAGTAEGFAQLALELRHALDEKLLERLRALPSQPSAVDPEDPYFAAVLGGRALIEPWQKDIESWTEDRRNATRYLRLTALLSKDTFAARRTPAPKSLLSGAFRPTRAFLDQVVKQLHSSGYSTAVFGKMHFNQPGHPGLHGLQVAVTEDVVQREWSAWAGPAPELAGIATKPVWKPFKDPARIWLNADKYPFPRRYEQMKSTWVAQQACRYLTQHKDDTFALWVSFTEPHSPFDFPIENRSDFDAGSFSVPSVGPEDASQIPLIFRDLKPADKQGIISAYYTSVHYLDRNIGVVLNKLRELDLENDTLVIYMADHGYSLGQHGRFEKHCCFDPALRVPLIFRWPGRIRPKTVAREFTESIDVPPTITDLMRIEPFAVNHGNSLSAYLSGHKPKPRQSIFSEYLENEEACLRTSRWKFVQCSGKRVRTDGYITENPTPGRYFRLFDLQSDPGEFHNVASAHPELVAAFSSEMLARFRKTHPDSSAEPPNLTPGDAIDWYLRPRDARPSAAA